MPALCWRIELPAQRCHRPGSRRSQDQLPVEACGREAPMGPGGEHLFSTLLHRQHRVEARPTGVHRRGRDKNAKAHCDWAVDWLAFAPVSDRCRQ